MIKSELRIMRGPNMWSSVHKLIVLKLDFSTVTQKQINRILKWEYLNEPIPYSGPDPTSQPDMYLASLIGKLVKDLQPHSNELFMDLRSAESNSCYAIIEYKVEKAGEEAAKSAVKILDALLKKGVYDAFDTTKARISRIVQSQFQGPSTSAIIEAALKKGIPVNKCPGDYIVFGQGKYQKRIAASISATTGKIPVDIAGDKEITKQILAEAFIPVPKGFVISKKRSIKEILPEIEFPVVVKPLNANQGKGITGNIENEAALIQAFKIAQKYSHYVIVEKQIIGNDYRFLVIGNKLVAVARRTPASVKGNSRSTIRELIDIVNSDPNRGEGHGNALTKITINEGTLNILKAKDLTLDSILEKDHCLFLKDTANLSTGGTAIDVTDEVHPDNIILAERAASLIGLDICGIDIMAPDITTPIAKNGGAVLEVNAAPGLRMHVSPSHGIPRNVGDAIVDLLYPEHAVSRIPIVAVTGTNGKTTTSRLMAYITHQQGYKVGLTTTEGIYLNNALIYEGDCSGPQSAKMVLQETSIDFAVLECARGGIIRNGLSFDQCDIAIVTNVASDHLGLKGIHTLEDLADVKFVVPNSVKQNGYAILNAADDLVYKMKDRLTCSVALFCLDAEHPRIIEHCKSGGYAVAVDKNKDVIIMKGTEKTVVATIADIPCTMSGKASFMIENILPVALASYLLKFDIATIKNSLQTFKLSVEQTPGRLNHFDFNGVTLIVDYAHNPHGLKALGQYLANIDGHITGIITGVGDRRDDDIIEAGKIAAEIYDEVIIRFDKDRRGRSENEIAHLLVQGITAAKPDISYKIVADAKEALQTAIANAQHGSYIVMCAENALETIHLVKELQEEIIQKALHKTIPLIQNRTGFDSEFINLQAPL